MIGMLLPLMIAGGFDGVEPFQPAKPDVVVAEDGRKIGIRELARLTNTSVSHVWYIRHGQRTSARFERKMRELGLTFAKESAR